MTNSLIPYSFIPGTKAKAQEVNANFIALANQITENKDYTDLKIENSISSLSDEKAGKKLENTCLISNCVLEAPNGIVTYTGNTITVKAGLKVLIPDGRNEDGSLKSIEYTVPADVLLTTVKNTTKNCVYVTQTTAGTADVFYFGLVSPKIPGGILYNPQENKNYFYDSDAAVWEEFSGAIIATYENTNDAVTNVKVNNPVGLLKENDILSVLSLGMPDYPSAVTKSNGATHTATVNGFVYCNTESQQNIWRYLALDGKNYIVNYHISGSYGYGSLFVPIGKGSTYSLSSGNTNLVFIPMKGEA